MFEIDLPGVKAAMWEIWLGRNACVFQSERRLATLLAYRAVVAAAERWNAANETVRLLSVNWHRPEWTSLPLQSPRSVVWRALTLGWLKVNFDGSMCATRGWVKVWVEGDAMSCWNLQVTKDNNIRE